MDREPHRRFLLTGSSARSLHRAGVNLLGGRAGRRIMPPFLAAELAGTFNLAAQPKFYVADRGIAMTLRPNDAARAIPDAVGAAREGLVYQHLAAWCSTTAG